MYSLKKGLGRNVEWFYQINGVELAKHLQVVVAVLESHLRQTYGYEWEQHIDIPRGTAKQKVLRCSFCEKQEGEVAKVIVGPSSNICNECVGICNEIWEMQQKQRVPAEGAPNKLLQRDSMIASLSSRG